MKKLSANYFIRHVDLGDLLETFLATAVFSMLSLRALLHVFGYPQIASESLHIAHVLWGGMLMLLGLVFALAFLNKEARYMAAILGGSGFGVFIDELGKFITHNNDYFYQPTFALIYLIFIGLFYLFRMLERIAPLTSQEFLINAMEFLKEAVVHDLDKDEQARALQMLHRVQSNEDLVQQLKAMLQNLDALPPNQPGLWKRVVLQLREFYAHLVQNKFFSSFVITYFALVVMVALYVSVFLVRVTGFWSWGLRMSALGVGILVLIGAYSFYFQSRLKGYQYYRQAVLFALFLFQFFLFYFHPLLAVGGLLGCLLTLVALHYASSREARFEQVKSEAGRKQYRTMRWLLKRFVERAG